jgi:GNAT superfamily N-acetyltransferase
VNIREVVPSDIPAMASIRAAEWETYDYWLPRITAYLEGRQTPGHGLPERAAFVAEENGEVLGFVAGNLSTRHGCQAELQWINVAKSHRGKGIASALLKHQAEWFIQHNALKVCVDADSPELYAKHGAKPLKGPWMFWEDIRLSLQV